MVSNEIALRRLKLIFLALLLCVCFAVAIKIGAVPIDVWDVLAGTASYVKTQVFLNIRLPRVILAALVDREGPHAKIRGEAWADRHS